MGNAPTAAPWFRCRYGEHGFPRGEIIFIETHENFPVLPSPALQQAADALFGEETYYVKVDTTLPERARPQWARKSEGNGEG